MHSDFTCSDGVCCVTVVHVAICYRNKFEQAYGNWKLGCRQEHPT